MKIKYKFTDENMRTHNGCQWTLGEWEEVSGKGELCNNGWLHCYCDPLLAILLNPIHGDYKNPRLWEVEVGGAEKHDGQLKSGYTQMRLLKEIKLPVITIEQRVRFGILCAKEVCKDKKWNIWADEWLDGTDRTNAAANEAAAEAAVYEAAAEAAVYAAAAAVYAANEAYVAKAAAEAAVYAACAAEAAANAAYAAKEAAEAAVYAAVYAAEAAYAAKAAVYAAEAAYAAANKDLDLIAIARMAIN